MKGHPNITIADGEAKREASERLLFLLGFMEGLRDAMKKLNPESDEFKEIICWFRAADAEYRKKEADYMREFQEIGGRGLC